MDKFVLVYASLQGCRATLLRLALQRGRAGQCGADRSHRRRARELLTRVRQANPLGARVLASVLSLARNASRRCSRWSSRKRPGGFIENELRSTKSKPKHCAEPRRAQGLNQDNYRENPASDAIPSCSMGSFEASTTLSGRQVRVRRAARSEATGCEDRAPRGGQRDRARVHDSGGAPATGKRGRDRRPILAVARVTRTGSRALQERSQLVGGAARELVFVHQRRVVMSGPIWA